MTNDELTIHVGRGWTDSLAQRQRPVSPEDLYEAVAYVDVAQGAQVVFGVARPVRVLPFIFSWIDQLMRAFKNAGQEMVVGDGADLLWLSVEQRVVTLRDESQHAQMGHHVLLRSLRRTLEALARDLREQVRDGALDPVQEQLRRAKMLIDRSLQSKPPKRHRALHTARALQVPPEQDVALDATSVEAQPPSPKDPHAHVRRRLRHIQFLELEHKHLMHLPSKDIREVFFDADDALVLCGSNAVYIADARTGHYRALRPQGVSEDALRGVRHVDGCVLFEHGDEVRALLPDQGWSTVCPLQGAKYARQVRGVVATTHEVLAYVQGTTVYDAPSGVPLLHEVSSLVPRHDEAGQVVGWYALDHTRRTVWWDGGGEVAPFCTFEGACVQIVSCRHGIVAHTLSSNTRHLHWVQRGGQMAWTRALPFDVAEFRGGGTLHVDASADSPDAFGIHMVAAFRWWAFRVHVRTRLATLVLRGEEADAVRLHWARDGLVCASGERLCVYPLAGRAPEPLWEARVRKELGLLAPVFPLSVRGEFLVHVSAEAVVRRVTDGDVVTTYRNDWPTIFDCRFTPSMDLIVAAAVPGQRIDLYHAAPTRWLGLVSP